jgi:uncharacterized membrane protein
MKKIKNTRQTGAAGFVASKVMEDVQGEMYAEDVLDSMLNRGEITQEEYDWFKNEKK